MWPALGADELELLQRWCGLALIGINLAQRILILTGTAGGGKGTFIPVLQGLSGQPTSLAWLGHQLLCERFELGRFLGKTLVFTVPTCRRTFLITAAPRCSISHGL